MPCAWVVLLVAHRLEADRLQQALRGFEVAHRCLYLEHTVDRRRCAGGLLVRQHGCVAFLAEPQPHTFPLDLSVLEDDPLHERARKHLHRPARCQLSRDARGVDVGESGFVFRNEGSLVPHLCLFTYCRKSPASCIRGADLR